MRNFILFLCTIAALHLAPQAYAQDGPTKLDEIVLAKQQTNPTPALLSPKLFIAERRFELALQFSYLANDDFYNYFPLHLKVAYHFNDMWALELQSSILYIKSKTNLSKFLESNSTAPSDLKQIADTQLARFNLVAVFHPLYGKWSFNRFGLGHFDWGLYAGLGVVVVKEPKNTQVRTAAHVDAVLGSYFHFFLLPSLALRADLAINLYPSFNAIQVPCTIGLGISYFTPPIY